MIYIFSMLGYGDCLITLSLLEQQRHQEITDNYVVVGTKITSSVGELMREPPSSIVSLLPDVASFYVVKEQGALRAFADAKTVRRWGRQIITSKDVIIFEKEDWRNRWLLPREVGAVWQVPRQSTAYLDRALLFQNVFDVSLKFRSCALPSTPPRRLLLNPSARHRERVLQPPVMKAIFDLTRDIGIGVCLIDVDGSFEDWRNEALEYVKSPSLNESKNLLDTADCYLGPDSFFVHLAYYLGIPFFGFFRQENMYFSPPGMIEAKNYIHFDEARDIEKFRTKLSRFLLAGTHELPIKSLLAEG